ncbi:putative transposase [Gordonia rhizosphera NBRC 16068]|uniref:Putative transposase n=1 Tax=Gordonia rhizosphera NBRC 16068 TaxID=1108045 RepID=K6V041_9ACTN|nr:transposase [Gordonia rhizosphera]GAB89178.1 putative transposase [Gordonia rhizosphera NBRC 16068]
MRRIGIDEIAYRKGHRYRTVVVDHDTGRLAWAGEGGNKESLQRFFDELGDTRTQQLTHISADGATWIEAVLTERAPHTYRCMDGCHVIQWANRALDRCRSRLRGTVAGLSDTDRKHLRWALLKNPEDLTDNQRLVRETLVADVNNDLAVAYQLKEGLRHLYWRTYRDPERALNTWIRRAHSSGIPETISLATSVENHKIQIINAINCDMSNALAEATNTHLRALTKRSYGFHSADALIAMAPLTRGGVRPALPHQQTRPIKGSGGRTGVRTQWQKRSDYVALQRFCQR